MGKVMNTKWFIDKNTKLVDELYEDRIGKPLEELDTSDLSSRVIVKALTELRLYRLPPYFRVPTLVKGRIQAQSAICHDLEDPKKSAAVERELTSANSLIFSINTRHEPCTQCGARHASKDGLCYRCTAQGDKKLERELSREFNKMILKSDRVDGWVSPKTMLLASLIGCTHCDVKHTLLDPAAIWIGEELVGWGDGLCPDCLSHFPLGKTWSLPKGTKTNSPSESYDSCQVCSSRDFDYAVWGMCETCYQSWQDKYVDPDELYKLVEEYGALSALLIRSSADWLNYLRQILEHKYCWNPRRKSFPADTDLTPFKPRLTSDLRINLKEMIHGTDGTVRARPRQEED